MKARQRRLAQEEAVREQHTRLVVDRAGDPRFVQRSVGADGEMSLQWDPDTPAGQHLGGVLERQREKFRQKFGREIGAEDPIFFDPDADIPRAMDPDVMTAAYEEMLGEMIGQAEQMGIDPALLKASRDLGFMVTTENQHLFSAADIQAWQDTVEFYQEEDDGLGEDDVGLEDLLDVLTDELEGVGGSRGRRFKSCRPDGRTSPLN